MKELELKIEGMTCEHCVRTIRNALSSVEGVSKVEVFLEEGKAIVELEKDVPFKDLKRAVEEWGYRVVD